VSEPARLGLLIYLAGFLVRRQVEVRDTFFGVGKVMALLAAAGVLLLGEPDLGAAVVLTLAVMAMLWVAAAPILPFIILLGCGMGGLYLLIALSPYRLARLTGFMDPWADPFNTGFQLTQSLMAIGSGHWFGLGLGSSVQKMFYLPEAHTDFLFAILAEELGLMGSLTVIALYALMFWRCLRIADTAAQRGRWFGPISRWDWGVAGQSGSHQHWREHGLAAHQGPDLALDELWRQQPAGDVRDDRAHPARGNRKCRTGHPAPSAGATVMNGGTVLIMAGGTGGHVFPALAVARALRADGIAVAWLGSRGGMEERVVRRDGITFHGIRIRGLRGKGITAWLLAPLRLAGAMAEALAVMIRLRPRVVLGMGGFAAGPGGLAAWLLRRPW